ncbi:NAD(P)/FAD-dependent oxidoreductase [Actinoalloteichus hymeniacidonis]|uniref:Pyridine nucleotide-disulfide oxidoreductase/Reductase C-terminal n=1 Tax=Actinoalloteichus hymeniacidonis TaxID=340345 RepID=A0AAC9MXD8_9PSEU|nr:FAD-dependent oxidoreductase [Actinoalloteichus hymeniacidonis]AOS62175.1 Pyridine nucleotide-disulfide oxidoreductase/Reductase C-terminal [Actinoalloteichus hymeniacidonis]MBB5909800.1 3-phenylpropionate/trans-cinnamate dioxygenase ferredoxin reductase subunit [Actinoalloteichus hymeniacidonis]
MRTVTVVGAGLAGWHAVRELRDQGFTGTVVVVGAEAATPYDRPPLSKGFLRGDLGRSDLALATDEELAATNAHWLTGTAAVRLDPATKTVELADGRLIATDGVVLATGARARNLQALSDIDGVYTLRTVADAEALRAALTGRTPRTVIVGAGFIGAEVAAGCHALGIPVTVVEAMPVPMGGLLGPTVGAACQGLHTDHGVPVHCGFLVAEVRTHPGTRRVSAVVAGDGRLLPADVLVVGVGARPETEWLAGSGLELVDGVGCDAFGATALPGVVALGDVANYADPAGGSRRHEHWAAAVEQAPAAVRSLLTGRTAAQQAPPVHGVPDALHRPNRVPYFWSDQYSTRIQVAGHPRPTDEVEILEGSLADRDFAAAYRRDGLLTGVVAMNRGKRFTRLRRELSMGAAPLATG